MSASERLKALDAEWHSDEPFELTRQEAVGLALVTALPQIVAVVDYAERIATTDDPVWGTKDGLGFRLQNALSALEEALS